MSESGEDARLQRFIERERMGLTDEAKARIRELERVVAEKDARVEKLEEMLSEASRESIDRRARIKELEGQLSGLILEADKYADLDPYLDELLAASRATIEGATNE